MPRLLLFALVAGCTAVHALVAVGVVELMNEPGAAQTPTLSLGPRAVTIRSIMPPSDQTQGAPTAPDVGAAPPVLAAKPTTPELVGRRYFDVSEVDTPAAPQPDWQVDVDRLLASGVRRLNFEVLVSDEGVAERCRIMLMDPPDSLPAPAVAARLCTTRMTPAMRQGSAVASIRRIELMLAD